MDTLLDEIGVDYIVDCSAADAAGFQQHIDQGRSKFHTTIRHLWNEAQARQQINPDCDTRDLVSVRFGGRRIGKKTAQKVFGLVVDRIVGQSGNHGRRSIDILCGATPPPQSSRAESADC